MDIKNYISKTYPITNPFYGINSAEDALIKNGYLVIINEMSCFIGILTPSDLIQRPHKLVIDCFTEKDRLNENDTLFSSFNKLNENKTPALPLFIKDEFFGIIEKQTIIDLLTNKISELQEKSIISQTVKTKFLNNLSHEVRTPLNSIIGFLELLIDLNDDCKENYKEYFKVIRNNTDHFLVMMDDLVELALIQSGDTIKLNKKDCQIERIFAKLNEFFKGEILRLKKEIILDYTNPDSSLIINTDGNRLKHILFHLIGNAIKFSNKGNVIFGYRIKEEKNIEFFVNNSDTTIPDKYSTQIFEAFEKIEDAKSGFSDGLGIGLTIANKLTNLLGGNIRFESDTQKGTTFYFSLGIN
jgi:two-component system CheB/CheR fusion protein